MNVSISAGIHKPLAKISQLSLLGEFFPNIDWLIVYSVYMIKFINIEHNTAQLIWFLLEKLKFVEQATTHVAPNP